MEQSELILLLAYLTGKEMPTDFHKDLVVLVRNLVPRYNDLCARQVLQLVYLKRKPEIRELTFSFTVGLTYRLQTLLTDSKSITFTSLRHAKG